MKVIVTFCQRGADVDYHYPILLGYSFSSTKMGSISNVHLRTFWLDCIINANEDDNDEQVNDEIKMQDKEKRDHINGVWVCILEIVWNVVDVFRNIHAK